MELDKLFAALAKAQGEFPPIGRERTVKIKSSKGDYQYNYAPLDVIFAAVRPVLSRNGLAIVQLVEGASLITILGHESGQQITATMALSGADDIKAWGGEITYCRRYALQAMLGIAAEEDEDASPGKSQPRERKATPEPRPEPTDPAALITHGEPPKAKMPPVTFEDPLAFKAAADDLARRVPHYQTATGATNKPHIMNALAALGYTRITAENVAAAIAALEQHARERAAAQATAE